VAAKKQGFGISIGKGTKLAGNLHPVSILKVMLFVVALGAVLGGFAFLDRYVKEQTPVTPGGRKIELVGETPGWVTEEIKNRVYAAATADESGVQIDENAASAVQRSIERLVPWLAEVKVQTTHNSIRIAGRWRKPIAMVTADSPRPTSGQVEAGKNKFFLDADLIVLDYIPVGDLSVVTVDGLEFTKQKPVPGQVFQGDDLAAALAVLSRLERMDAAVKLKKPLMREIVSIDVSNFDGRKNKHEPHIVLYTKDKTQIIWGAEIGGWQRQLESPDDDKLAKLYTYYQQYGTLSGVKYINLRDPRQTIYLPVDKY
jgi:hypothetical protein